MKKIILLFVLLCLWATSFAQLKIDSQGKAIIGSYGSTTDTRLECRGPLLLHCWGGADWEDIHIDWNNNYSAGQIYCTSFNFMLGTPAYYVGRAYLRYAYLNNAPIVSSDIRLKENVKPIESALQKIMRISGKSFNYIQDSSRQEIPAIKANLTKTTFGFIAQELEGIVPEAVEKPSELNKYYGVNYMAIIPLLVEAVKEQQQMIDSLKAQLAECCSSSEAMLKSKKTNTTNSNPTTQQSVIDDVSESKIILYQNKPNPFSDLTTISCYIPKNIQNAQICVYDMQGHRVECIPVSGRGPVDVKIAAGKLSAGIYSYILIADNGASEAKQMILTR